MIISKTPFRIPLAGGGTDIDFYYKKKPGLFLTCAFNQGIYVSVSKRPLDKKILIQTTDTQFCYSVNQIKHEIIREVLRYFNVKNQIQINCFSTLPTQSGLGSSSSLIVGLITAITKLLNLKITKKKIVEIAFYIERKKLGLKGGWQDQIASTFGGIIKVGINRKGVFKVQKINIKKKVIQKLNSHMILVFTNETRDSSKIIKSQNKKINIDYYDKIKSFVPSMKAALTKGDYVKIGKIFHKHWNIKKKLSKNITNSSIDKIYFNLLKDKNIIGGKIIGAGGGGFFLLVTKNLKKTILKFKRQKLNFSRLEIGKVGSQIIST